MIVSHANRFIFIKTRKTGGTSIEIALSKYLGPEDIVSPISAKDEAVRSSLGQPGARNHSIPYKDYTALDWVRYMTSLYRRNGPLRPRYKNHMRAREVRRRLGHALWSDYFSFAVERNPWDKVVSAYFWHFRDRQSPGRLAPDAPDFAAYVRSGVSAHFSDFKVYGDRGRVIVNRVLRYENLQAELAAVASEIGLTEIPDISRSTVNAKSGLRPSGDYRSYYTDELREIVARRFAREIDLLGYVF